MQFSVKVTLEIINDSISIWEYRFIYKNNYHTIPEMPDLRRLNFYSCTSIVQTKSWNCESDGQLEIRYASKRQIVNQNSKFAMSSSIKLLQLKAYYKCEFILLGITYCTNTKIFYQQITLTIDLGCWSINNYSVVWC